MHVSDGLERGVRNMDRAAGGHGIDAARKCSDRVPHAQGLHGEHDVSRRDLLAGLAALGTGALTGCVHMGPSAVAGRRIDMQQHFFPPALLSELKTRDLAEPSAL